MQHRLIVLFALASAACGASSQDTSETSAGSPSPGEGAGGTAGSDGKASAGGGNTAGAGGSTGGSGAGAGAAASGGSAGAGSGGAVTAPLLPPVTSTTFSGVVTAVLPAGFKFDGEITVLGLGVQSYQLYVRNGNGIYYTNCLYPSEAPCQTSAPINSTPPLLAATIVAPIVDANGNIQTFARDTGGHIRGQHWDYSLSMIVSNQLPAAVQTPFAPGAAASSAGEIDAFVVDDSGHLRHAGVLPEDPAWEDLGGSLASAPAAAYDAPGSLHVVAVRSSDGALVERTRTGGSWSAEQSWEGSFSSATAVSWGAGRLDVIARTKAGGLVYRARRESGELAPTWTDIPMPPTVGTPSAFTYGKGQLVVVAKTPEGKVVHTRLIP